MKRRKLDRWGQRRHPNHYDPATLREMLLDDIVRTKPLGGPGEAGCQWLVLACARIAKRERKPVDDVFTSILAEGATLTGTTALPLA